MLLVDGFSTTFTFTDPAGTLAVAGGIPVPPGGATGTGPGTLYIQERDFTPPGLAGGGSIETSTMRNSRLRTFAPKSLKTLTEMSGACMYDPYALFQVFTAINIVLLFAVLFPDAATMSFYGWFDELTPQSHKEGDFPLANFKVIPGNVNPVAPYGESDMTMSAGVSPGVRARG